MSQYGGQAAAAGVAGFQQGYNFIDKATAAKDEAELRKQKIERAQMENELYNVAVDDARNKQPSAEQERIIKLEENVAKQEQINKKNNSNIVTTELNTLTVAPDMASRDKAVQTLQSRIKANPQAFEALQIQDPDSIGIVNVGNSNDKKKLTAFLETQGINAEAFGFDLTTDEGKEQWTDTLYKYANSIPAVMADSQLVPLESLGIAMGSTVQLSPEQKKQMEQNERDIQAISNNMLDPEADTSVPNANDPEAIAKAEQEAGMGVDDVGVDPTEPVDFNDPEAMARAERQVGMETDGIGTETQAPKPTSAQIAASATKPTVDQEIDQASQMMAITDFNQKREQGTNFKGNPYTRKNEAGSSAYGKYQVMPDTNATVAARLGMSVEESLTPEGQEAVFKELTRENSSFLKKWGVDDTPASQYVVHQLGSTQAKKYFDGEIDGKVMSAMKNQYSSKAIKGMSDNEVLAKWTKDFGMDDNGEVTSKEAINQQVATMSSEAKPAGEWDMEKVYALLGKKYPGTETTKMQNFNFLTSKGFTEAESFDAVFGKATGAKGRMEKAMDARSKYAVGSPEYVEYTNYIEKMGRVGTASEADYNKWDTELQGLENIANPSDMQMDRMDTLREKMSDSKKTASEQTADSKTNHRRTARNSISNIESSRGYAKGELTQTQSNQLLDDQELLRTNSPSKTVERDGQLVKDMSANYDASLEITDVLGRMEAGGDLAPMEKGILDNTAQWVEEKLPGDMDPSRKATIEANIKAGSALGYLQATLIKAMSGTAAAEAEVMRLQKVMQGSDWNQPEALKVALNEFNDGLKRRNKRFGDQLRVSPYENYHLNQLGEPTRSGKPTSTKAVTPGSTEGKTVVTKDNVTDSLSGW